MASKKDNTNTNTETVVTEEKAKRIRRGAEDLVPEIDKKIEKEKQAIAKLEQDKQSAIAEYDGKIAKKNEMITKLEERKERLLNPETRTRRKTGNLANIISQAKAKGMSTQDIAKALGISIEE